jgi:hypothetical protein
LSIQRDECAFKRARTHDYFAELSRQWLTQGST